MSVSAAEKIRAWREDPILFVREVFGVEPDAWQREALIAFKKNNRISLLACKGPGKTCTLAWCAWNFLATRPHPKVAATSISADNLADGLWTEMALWQGKSEFLKEMFVWTKTRIFAKQHPETWWMSARTWPKSADQSKQADTLAGLHADYLLFLIDEAGGVPDAVMAAAEAGLATGVETKILIAGNPTHLSGPLYRSATNERDMWYVIEINSDPDNPDRTPRVSKEWAREQIKKYGRDNPFVLVNVFGKFPPSSLNSLLGPDDVERAMKREYKEHEFTFSQKRVGVDVALYGDDSTVIFKRQGLVAFPYTEMRVEDTSIIASNVMRIKNEWNSELEFVDTTGGFGSGVVDFMHKAGGAPIGVHFASKANDSKYLNRRAEMWMEMANWIKEGGKLPKCDILAKELVAPVYTMTANGKFQLESKDQIKKRLGFSPDRADALALTWAIPDLGDGLDGFTNFSLSNSLNLNKRNKVKAEWDPFADDRF